MNSKQITTLQLGDTGYPSKLKQLSQPPETLYINGAKLEDWLDLPKVGIVGSRKVSSYGRAVTEKIASQLAGQGIMIISGLALGVDSIAHIATLGAGGRTVAVLPGPVETIYPRSHDQLGRRIAANGGSLISEYPDGTPPLRQNFIGRNRIVAALSDLLLITEAAEKSGSLHTARFALELGRDVAAVPGNITSPTSVGCNNLIKAGAVPVTDYTDVLNILKIAPKDSQKTIKGANEAEQVLIDLLSSGVSDGEELHTKSGLAIEVYNQNLTMLEITGKVRSLGANKWTLD